MQDKIVVSSGDEDRVQNLDKTFYCSMVSIIIYYFNTSLLHLCDRKLQSY